MTAEATASLLAEGGRNIHGSYGYAGSGGRIALGSFLTDALVAELARTGVVAGKRMAYWGRPVEDFLAEHPGVTVDVGCGEDGFDAKHDGTFRYLRPHGLVFLVR